MSEPAMPGAMRTAASGGSVAAAEQSPIDTEVEAEEILGDGHTPSSTSNKADQPGNGPKAPKGQAEKPEPRGKHAGTRIRRHAVQGWGRVDRTRRGRNTNSQTPARPRRRPRPHRGVPSRARPERRAASAEPSSLGPQSLAFLTQSRGRQARARLGAPRQKALKISSNERVLPPCRDVIA